MVFALFDFHLHANKHLERASAIQALAYHIQKKISLIPVSPNNRFQNSFSHIFAGSYAAGYYCYAWADMLACDAFAKFEAYGTMSSRVGKSFLKYFLSQGGAQDSLNLFKNFRGRKPTMTAFLKQLGI
jgi:oligopeptidase A